MGRVQVLRSECGGCMETAACSMNGEIGPAWLEQLRSLPLCMQRRQRVTAHRRSFDSGGDYCAGGLALDRRRAQPLSQVLRSSLFSAQESTPAPPEILS